MNQGRGLVVIHIDGLGADSLENAFRDGDMPFTKSLMESEGQAHPFVFAKGEWELDTTVVDGAHELHPILSRLRERLSAAAE